VTRDGKLVIDDPEIRQRLVKAINSYTAVYRKGCIPPDSVSRDDGGNNQAFLAETVLKTTNKSLPIPAALKVERSDDYSRARSRAVDGSGLRSQESRRTT
jgi:hypothetical protein